MFTADWGSAGSYILHSVLLLRRDATGNLCTCPQIGEYLTTGKVAVLDPANQAAEQAAKVKAAEQKATGDAFAFI